MDNAAGLSKKIWLFEGKKQLYPALPNAENENKPNHPQNHRSILLSYFPSQGPKHPKTTCISKCILIIPLTGACPAWEITATAGPAKEMKELWDKAADKNSCIKLLQYQSPDLPRNAEHTQVNLLICILNLTQFSEKTGNDRDQRQPSQQNAK